MIRRNILKRGRFPNYDSAHENNCNWCRNSHEWRSRDSVLIRTSSLSISHSLVMLFWNGIEIHSQTENWNFILSDFVKLYSNDVDVQFDTFSILNYLNSTYDTWIVIRWHFFHSLSLSHNLFLSTSSTLEENPMELVSFSPLFSMRKLAHFNAKKPAEISSSSTENSVKTKILLRNNLIFNTVLNIYTNVCGNLIGFFLFIKNNYNNQNVTIFARPTTKVSKTVCCCGFNMMN